MRCTLHVYREGPIYLAFCDVFILRTYFPGCVANPEVSRKRPRALALVEPRRLPVLSGRCPHQTGIALVPLPPSEPGVQIFRTGLPKISLSGLDCPMDHLGLG